MSSPPAPSASRVAVCDDVPLAATAAGGTRGDEECCTLATGPLDAADAQRLSEAFKALSDPTRLRLLAHVADQGCASVCACDLTELMGISQPTVSHHMKKLVEAGLVTREQRGRWAHYSVVPAAFAELRAFLDLR
ncbi:metalloregulator ArsR/SmtB family transcription factor [Brachybacterium muris]|uniref:ArsR/SmtB family transcription factor n=1 Tax=Brachybacterium muris TaxID=219301 RepID=UPI0021A8F73B|nr:metalloregulator ArsR/SmtB family transcription factor [Brachybacterium muris]MCT1431908.1 metalloregulator ArsR/SmtB family transcription factor [Brachybacterium muris]